MACTVQGSLGARGGGVVEAGVCAAVVGVGVGSAATLVACFEGARSVLGVRALEDPGGWGWILWAASLSVLGQLAQRTSTSRAGSGRRARGWQRGSPSSRSGLSESSLRRVRARGRAS